MKPEFTYTFISNEELIRNKELYQDAKALKSSLEKKIQQFSSSSTKNKVSAKK